MAVGLMIMSFVLVGVVAILLYIQKQARAKQATKDRIKSHQLVSLEAPINKAIAYLENALIWRRRFPLLRLTFPRNMIRLADLKTLLDDLKSGADPRVPYLKLQVGSSAADMGGIKCSAVTPRNVSGDITTHGGHKIYDIDLDASMRSLIEGSPLAGDRPKEPFDFWDWEPPECGIIPSDQDDSVLSVISMQIFDCEGLFFKFRIEPHIFKNFVQEIVALSHDNPFHNGRHAADVLQSLHWLFQGAELRPMLNNVGILAGYIAAIVMDVGHLGVTNSFLQESGHQLANTYCLDNAIQECFHASIFCQLLASKQTNFLAKMDPTLFKQIKDLVLALITATDMNRHYQILNTFQTSQNILPEMLVIGLAEEDCESLPKAYPAVEEKAFLYLQIALKCADVAWTGRPFHAHLRWAERYQEERFSQGDKERLLGFRVGSSNDRKRGSKARARALVAFYEFVVHPLFKSFECVFPSCSEMVKHAEKNYWYWELTST